MSLSLALVAALCASTALAQDVSLTVEPAAAFWLDDPQSDRFNPGMYLAVRPGIELGPVVGFQLSYALLLSPPRDGFTDTGSANFLTAGMHLRPFAPLQPDDQPLGGLILDGNVGFVRTGDFDRLGFDAGLGYGIQLAPSASLGPVVRYAQIIQPDTLVGVSTDDAQALTAGLSLVIATRAKEPAAPATLPPPARACPEAAPCVQEYTREMAAAERALEVCSDRDRDGVCDADDRCPDVAGPAAALGCPLDPCSGRPLIVFVQFPFDSDTLPPPKEKAMDPVLDAIAAAIAKDPTCRVCTVGHASMEGPAGHNQTLSVQRAQAVQGYLAARKVDGSRLLVTGMGERCQLVPKTTLELNRRVDFIRLGDGERCPTECPE